MSELPKGLEQDVKNYFASTTHKGFRQPFELQSIRESELFRGRGSYWAIPRGVDEDIREIDDDFNRELAKIGQKYGVNISLPYWVYEK